MYTSGTWQVKKGKEGEFKSTFDAFAKWTAEIQPDFINGVLLQDTEDKSKFISFGEWKDRRAIESRNQDQQF